VIRNSGQVPEEIRTRQLAEDAKYGALWRKLIQDAETAGDLRPDLDPRIAQRLVIGALNWAAEWWNPRRDSLDSVVRTAQSLTRHGLSKPSHLPDWKHLSQPAAPRPIRRQQPSKPAGNSSPNAPTSMDASHGPSDADSGH
jgi:Tetracyclin repressor-like, C-terminal domain